MAKVYCARVGIPVELLGPEADTLVQEELVALQQYVENTFEARLGDVEKLCTYSTPILGKGGSCSLFGQLDPKPYDLRGILGPATPSLCTLLARAQSLVEAAQIRTGVDWVRSGI